jgi:hypothetical protein
MSKMSGDTARFHRIRNRQLVKRVRVRELRAEIAARKVAADSANDKSKQ